MDFVGAIPWIARGEAVPRPPFDLELGVPLQAQWSMGIRRLRIRYEWNEDEPSYKLLFLNERYQRIALSVVVDILAPIVFKELYRYMVLYPSQVNSQYFEEEAEVDAGRVEEAIGQLREGIQPNFDFLRLSMLLHSRSPGGEIENQATLSIMAWADSLTDILDLRHRRHDDSFPQQIESALIPIAYYLYYYVIQAPQRDDFSPVDSVSLPLEADDGHLDVKYFTESLNWAIDLWWKEFLDTLAFRQ